MGINAANSRFKQSYQIDEISNRGLIAQICGFWIKIGSRTSQSNIQWEQVFGPRLFPVSENQYPIGRNLQLNKACFITRAVMHRWEGFIRHMLCLLARKREVSLMILADPKEYKRIIDGIEPSQPSVQPKYKRIIQSLQQTSSESEGKIQQIRIYQSEIVKEISYKSFLFDQVLQYLIKLLRISRFKIKRTNFLIIVEIFYHRLNRMARLEQIMAKMHHQVVETAFNTLIAAFEARKEQQSLMDSELLQYIHETCERNQTIRADLGHFLVPYAVLLRMLQKKSPVFADSPYISGVIHFILDKMAKVEIKYQMGTTVHRSFPDFIKGQRSYQELREYMRMILVTEKRIMEETVPFYYNFFALVINQQFYFKGGTEELLDYTVNFNYPRLDPTKVQWQHVLGAIARMQVALRERYHSKYA